MNPSSGALLWLWELVNTFPETLRGPAFVEMLQRVWGLGWHALFQPGRDSLDWSLALLNLSPLFFFNLECFWRVNQAWIRFQLWCGQRKYVLGGRWVYIGSLDSGSPERSSPSCSALGPGVTGWPCESGGSGSQQGSEAASGQGSKWGHGNCVSSVSSPWSEIQNCSRRGLPCRSARLPGLAWSDLARSSMGSLPLADTGRTKQFMWSELKRLGKKNVAANKLTKYWNI